MTDTESTRSQMSERQEEQPEDEPGEEEEKEDEELVKLTEVVRKQYFQFLERQLKENVLQWRRRQKEKEDESEDGNALEGSIHKCAEILEDSAIKKSILTKFFQQEMIKRISAVRKNTKDGCLVKELQDVINSKTELKEYATKATQTEMNEKPREILSLDERIELLQGRQNKNKVDGSKLGGKCKPQENKDLKRRRLNEHQHRKEFDSQKFHIWHSPTPPPITFTPPPQPSSQMLTRRYPQATVTKETTSVVETETKTSTQNKFITSPLHDHDHDDDDEIAKELEKLFAEQETDLNEIFGLKPENQLNCDTLFVDDNSQENLKNKCQEMIPKNEANNNINVETTQGFPNESMDKSEVKSIHNSFSFELPQPVKDLRHSLWPCELLMQKRRLATTLNRLIDEDFRWRDILKLQFSILFGDDDCNEFSICSPSAELDDITKNSCMYRISPWVVKHLMKPFHGGLIGNRFLFKKLAKKLAQRIVMENQYPDEYDIKIAVENFFCMHPRVTTAEDLNDIDSIELIDSNL